MDVQNLLLTLPYKIDDHTVAVLTHSIKNGNQLFTQTVYGGGKSNRKGMTSTSLTERMYLILLSHLNFQEVVFNPMYCLPEKLSLAIGDDVKYMYTDTALDNAVEKAIDGAGFGYTSYEIEKLCKCSRADLYSLAKRVNVEHISDLII